MKQITILLLLTLSACTKSPQDEVTPLQEKHFSLSFAGDGVAVDSLQNSLLQNATTPTGPGYFIRFEKDSFVLGAFLVASQIVQASGTINGRSFILHPADSTVNICNGTQNMKVKFKIKEL